MTCSLSLLVLVLFAAPQQDAPSAPDPERMLLQLKTGELLRATVLGLEGQRVRLEVSVLGGTAKVSRSLDDFVPRSTLDIELHVDPPQGYAEHLAMARRAAELDLVQSAGEQARSAIDALGDDPARAAKEAEVRAWAANALEQKVRDAIEAGDPERAHDLLDLLSARLPDQRSEEQLDALAAAATELEQEQAAARARAREARMEERRREEFRERIEPIREKEAFGDRVYREALKTSGSTARSARACEVAVEAYREAWQRAAALAERFPDDGPIQEAVLEASHRMEQKTIRAALHAASVLTTQSDFVGATEWCRRILAFDPGNGEAQRMLETVQMAQADAAAWKWNWRRRGRRGVLQGAAQRLGGGR